MKPKILIVKTVMSLKDIDSKEGGLFPESHYKNIITSDTDAYGLEDDGTKKLLFKFRKNVIPNEICTKAYNALEKHAQKKNYNRGAASGKLNINRLPKHIGKITKRDSFRIYYKTKDGKPTNDNVGNMALSNIAGYFDKPDRNEYIKLKLMKLSKTHKKSRKIKKLKTTTNKPGYDLKGVPMCRTTKFTKYEVEKWNNTIPLIKEADKQFSLLIPDRHKIQLDRANQTPQFQIAKTAYSTITVNYNWRTALHKDKGDLEEGFGNLLVLEKAKSCNNNCKSYKGGYLGFPRWAICVDVRQGDFLAMDVHEYHCNTPIEGDGRLSVVCYLRKKMINCKK